MRLSLLSLPAEEPISLDDAKVECRVEHAEHDALLRRKIAAYTQAAEAELRRALVDRTWRLELDALPACGRVVLDKAVVRTIDAVRYRDAAGDEQVLDPATYELVDELPAEMVRVAGAAWPTDVARGSVRIDFVVGYGAAADVPAMVRDWIMVHVAAAYRHPEAFATGVSVSVLPGRFVERLLDGARLRA